MRLQPPRFHLLHARYIVWISGFGVLAALMTLMVSPVSPFRYTQPLVFDTYQRLHPRPHGDAPVVIVDIDEESISRVGQWPWSRKTLAMLTERLGELGAAVVVFDIIFSEPDRTSPARILKQLGIETLVKRHVVDPAALDHDRIFAQSIARTPVVAGALISPDTKDHTLPSKAGISFGGRNPAQYLPQTGGALSNLPQLNDAATGIGVINFNPLFDGVVRKVPLLVRSADQLVPSLAAEALRVAQGASGFLVRSTGASGEADTGLPAMISIRIGDFTVPTSADGALWVYYSDGKKLKTLSAHNLLKPQPDDDLAEQIDGHIVLVGASAYNLRDQRTTPLQPSVAGVTIHAEILDQIIAGVSLSRPDWAPGLEFVAIILCGLLVLVVIPYLPEFFNTLWMLLLTTSIAFVGWVAFYQYHLLLDPLPAIAGVILVFGAASIARLLMVETQAKFVRQAFGQYLAPALVDKIARKPDELKLSGETRQLTLLFCDIRDFTGISESLDPLELTRLLNDFLTPVTDVLIRNGATIDKYVGDMVMAFWNAPIEQVDHAALGCRAILEIQDTIAQMSIGGIGMLRAGIGLNTGECCVGNLGSAQHFNYSAIGDTVNVASRIESLTRQYDVTNLITDATANAAPAIRKIEVDWVKLVGKETPVTIHTLLGDDEMDSPAFARLQACHQRFLNAYRKPDPGQAQQTLQALRKIAPASLHGLYEVFSGRLEAMQIKGATDNWTGVYVAKEK